MALKSQTYFKIHCFRASENPENSRRSAQNASKTSILHVNFAVAIVIKKTSKITPKWPKKIQKSTPRRLQDGPQTAPRQPKMAPRRPKTAQGGPRRPQDASRRSKTAPRHPQERRRERPGRSTTTQEGAKKGSKIDSDLRVGFGDDLGSISLRFLVDFGSMLASMWGRFGVDLGSIRSRCWVGPPDSM